MKIIIPYFKTRDFYMRFAKTNLKE